MITLLQVVACSLMTKESKQTDIGQFFETIPLGENENHRFEHIINCMHEDRRSGILYNQFASKICEKINQCKINF